MGELHRYVVDSLLAEVKRGSELSAEVTILRRQISQFGSEEQEITNLRSQLEWTKAELVRVQNGEMRRMGQTSREYIENPPLDERLENQRRMIDSLEAEIRKVNEDAIATNAEISRVLENKITARDEAVTARDDQIAELKAEVFRLKEKKRPVRKR